MTKAKASGTIKCPHCRHPVPDGSRFCLFCGAPLGTAAQRGDPATRSWR
jgi:hypothetical protein